MRVPDRGELVRVRGVAMLVERGQDRRIALVAEAIELLPQAARPGLVARLRLERAQRLEVAGDAPGLGVEARDLAAQQLGRGVRRAEHPVAGELDLQLDRARLGRGGEHGVGPLAATARIQPLDDGAVAPQRRLTVRHEQEIDALAAPLLRHGHAGAEPVGRPLRPEALAGLRRPVRERLRLVPRDPVDRPGHEHGIRRPGLGIHALAQPRRHQLEAVARVFEVPDHGRSPGEGGDDASMSPP